MERRGRNPLQAAAQWTQHFYGGRYLGALVPAHITNKPHQQQPHQQNNNHITNNHTSTTTSPTTTHRQPRQQQPHVKTTSKTREYNSSSFAETRGDGVNPLLLERSWGGVEPNGAGAAVADDVLLGNQLPLLADYGICSELTRLSRMPWHLSAGLVQPELRRDDIRSPLVSRFMSTPPQHARWTGAARPGGQHGLAHA